MKEKLNELALFAGAGGGILGGKLLGWRTVCAVEWDGYARDVLVARQNDGCLDPFPIWDDIQTFDGKPWRGLVDVISGGFPCQDLSSAGGRAGLNGSRSGLWKEMARVVSEVRPRYVFVENSPMLVNRGLGRVIGDLTKMGYDCKWTVMGASDVGANHKRDRIWIVGNTNQVRLQRNYGDSQFSISQKTIQQSYRWWTGDWNNLPKPYYIRSNDGVACRVDRLKAIGNGQVPLCAATAWRILSE
jgi:DNA (cytosine-5)-methyltransferase 1